MGVFEEVFAKRCSPEVEFAKCGSSPQVDDAQADAEDGRPAGVFDQVFVRRGRWRSKTIPVSKVSGVEPESVAAQVPDTSKGAGGSRLIVKNTFIERGTSSDYDSLQEFLLERKVQSCPACLINIYETIGVDLDSERQKDEILETGSTYSEVCLPLTASDLQAFVTGSDYADVDMPLVDTLQYGKLPLDETFNTGSRHCQDVDMRLADVSCVKISLEEAVNRASNQWEIDSPVVLAEHQNMNGIILGKKGLYCQDLEASMSGKIENTLLHSENAAAEDRRASLRMNGSAIHQTILRIKGADINKGNVEPLCVDPIWEMPMDKQPNLGTAIPSHQVPWYDLTCENIQQLTPPPPPPLDLAPVFAPVLRLADAVPPPELGTPALPSIGSLLHHRHECKPCTFFHTRGCENKQDCQFCHLCGPGEKKKRLRSQRVAKRETQWAAMENTRAIIANYSAEEEFTGSDMIIE